MARARPGAPSQYQREDCDSDPHRRQYDQGAVSRPTLAGCPASAQTSRCYWAGRPRRRSIPPPRAAAATQQNELRQSTAEPADTV
jgi:hypothetical protein